MARTTSVRYDSRQLGGCRVATEFERLNMEPISFTLTALSAVLGIAASVSQLATTRRISRENAFSAFEQEASTEEKELLSDPKIRHTVLALSIISPDLLDQLVDEAQEAETNYIKERRKAQKNGSIVEKERARTKAVQFICSTLRDIILHNGGSLPDDDKLRNWSVSYDCQI